MRNEAISFEDIPTEYLLEKEGNLKFMMVGKITDPLEGCACSMADVTREFMGKVATKEKEIVLVDMEAGIESFGRGVERNVDTVMIVVEPSFESIALAQKIEYMADGIGVSKVGAILNKVPSGEMEQDMLKELKRREVPVVGSVAADARIGEANFRGEALGESKAKEDVRRIVRSLLELS